MQGSESHRQIKTVDGNLRVVCCFFFGLSAASGGAICDTSHSDSIIKKSGFCECIATSFGGAIFKQNGIVSLLGLCFEHCVISPGGNNIHGNCVLLESTVATVSRCTVCRCGVVSCGNGDSPIGLKYSSGTTKDLNAS